MFEVDYESRKKRGEGGNFGNRVPINLDSKDVYVITWDH